MAVGMAIYIATAVGHQQLDERISGLFSVEKIPYILYFILGTRARKNWSSMESLFDSKYGVAAFTILFIGLNVFGDPICLLPSGGVIRVIFTAVSGVFLTVAFFRHYADSFSSTRRTGKIMQYIVKRTLDIYLIHYFLMESLVHYGIVDFSGTSLCITQFLVCMAISAIVISGCLIVSNVLRMSPVLGYYLFGVKITNVE